ncbi:transposase [Fischerella muscicola CCMEE 5323]|uniref:Transposase n=2 Tax=Hapalosiphonaceae TaxID=1892263 RepID=A0A2N6JWG4_FISMU|nr:transposase [Fischerella muscicola]MBD2432276.1 transposase [Fischerella sp. FACHB-380]PLZ84449.1 transposase [Fischerella muscicola CCMEE 5323]
MVNHIRHCYRRLLRLSGYNYSQAGAYFLTICTYQRNFMLGDIVNNDVNLNELGNIVLDFWNSLPSKYSNIELDEFVIMPNHLHGIVVITDTNVVNQKVNVGTIHELSLRERRNMLLPKVVGYFKMNSAKAINQKLSSLGTSVWQRNYYEHIIRNEAELDRIRQYIVNNPVKWTLDYDNPDGKPDQEEIQFWRDFGRKDLSEF